MKFNYRLDTTIPENKKPAYQTDGSAGFDLILNRLDTLIIPPHTHVMLETGFFITEMSKDMMLYIKLRSSMAKKGLIFTGSGIIDSDYLDPNEIKGPVYNITDEDIILNPHDRILQAIQVPIARVGIPILTTKRTRGFGSTGI